MAKFNFEKRDLFSMPQGICLVHCISGDYSLGAGIATEFDYRYNMRERLILNDMSLKTESGCVGDAVKIDNVFNLITKEHYYDKPTYENLRSCLEDVRAYVIDDKIKHIAMPKIGTGLDKLKWEIVLSIIKDVFKDTDVEITICFLCDDIDFDICEQIKPLSKLLS